MERHGWVIGDGLVGFFGGYVDAGVGQTDESDESDVKRKLRICIDIGMVRML